ncbi:MAG: hypothetical protein HF314_02365 [Ignavibacteria bacterium]|nr:hypothetical protein [Ignavibacteria bacterium]MCU7501890.1 hypothetical protein [Ignavibacteria bacterium]MCU7514764.1 hypothetical protein [Ignavibacteria bacterium]
MFKKYVFVLLVLMTAFSQKSMAQGPEGKNFGFGIILGEPTGLTLKYWFNRQNALTGSIGGSYFGSPRINVDYLWHIDAFRSRNATLYAGLGGALGFGSGGDGFWYKDEKDRFFYRTTNEAGLGVRGTFGLNVIPDRVPLETFLEIGALVGLVPSSGAAIDLAIGLRFYP